MRYCQECRRYIEEKGYDVGVLVAFSGAVQDGDQEYFSSGKQDAHSMGRMTSVLKPVADHYNQLTSDARYQFRRLCRILKKWYGYISQVVQMFDADLHREYLFISCLLGLIPAETTAMIDLEGKLQLEYYKLQKTFEGAIELEEATGVYPPASAKGAVKPEEKQPLDEIIEKINDQYKGQFIDADKVLVDALRARLLTDKKLQAMAQSSNPQIFRESIFPKAFGTAAQDSYMESQDTYTSLFEDQAKYNAIMNALGAIIYRDMRGHGISIDV